MKKWMFWVVWAAAAVAEAVPPVALTNVVVQKYGEERTLEVQEEGLLFIDEYGDLYLGNGETAGGVKVCAHVDPDWHVWEKDVQANGHAIQWNRYWKQISEGGSLSYRYGTNTYLRLVGPEDGTLSNIHVDSSQVGGGILVISTDNPEAVLQASTNLLEAGAWWTATNAEITAQTDVSRTWTVTLMGTDAEFYRAIGEISVGSGIHAMRTIHAHHGIVDGDGAAITNWGDLTNSLSARLDAAVGGVETNAGNIATNAAAIAAHAAAIAANAGNIYNNAASLSWVTNALGQRISDFEEVRIKYSPGATTTNIWYVPTNGPTRNLTIYLDSYYSSTNAPLTVRIPADWHPNRPVKIKLLTSRASTAARINYGLGALAGWTYTPSQQQRVITFAWVPEAEAWTEYRVQTIASQGLYTGTSVTADTTASKLALMPATIEEWVAWRNQQPW